MPRIPEIRRASPVNTDLRIARQPRESLREAAASGEGIAELGSSIMELGVQMRKQERKVAIGEAKNRSLSMLKQMESQLSTGIITDDAGNKQKLSYNDAISHTKAQTEAIRNEVLSGIDDNVVRESVRLDFDRMAILTNARIRTDLAKLRAAEHTDTYLSQRDMMIQRIVDEEDPNQKKALQSMLLQEIAGASAAGLIDDPKQQLAEARHAIAVGQMHKTIRLDPETALERLRAGDVDPNLTEEDITTLTSTARTTMSARRAEAKRQKAADEDALKKFREGIGNEFVERLERGDEHPQGPLTANDVLDSELEPTGENSKQHWIKMINQKAEDAAKPPPNGGPMAVDLLKRIYLPNGDPRKITSMSQIEEHYYADNDAQRISYTDVTRLRKEFENARSEAGQRLGKVKQSFLGRYENLISPKGELGEIMRPGGGAAMYEFERYVDEQVQRMRDENKDPYKLFDPHANEFLGQQETIQMFVPPEDHAFIGEALGPQRTPQSLPLRNGKINPDRLSVGDIYTLPDGRQAEWDGAQFNILGGADVQIPLNTTEGGSTMRQTTVE